MKLFIFLLCFLSTPYTFGQELTNFYLEPNPTDNSVTLHTTVYRNSFSTFESFDINTVDNVVNLSMCYLNTSATSSIYDQQEFEINLPLGYSSYVINIELYGDNDALAPCALTNLTDTSNIPFDYPYIPLGTTQVPDDVFETFLEDIGSGDEILNNDLVFTHRI